MADLGFWSIAGEDPDHLAVVDPDGAEIRAGDLLGSANQLVHGLRQLGLEAGDSIAMVLPNSAEVFELYLAALQAGWYLIPINHHLVGPEIAYIVQDCDAKVLVAHERFAHACAAGAKELGFAAERSFAVGSVPGFRPYEELKEGQPTTLPADRRTGAVMNYTSGTTGKPKGVRRGLPAGDPESSAVSFGGMLLLFGLQPHDDNVHICGSPLYHTAVLVFAGGSLHLGHTVVLMDKWTPEGMLRLIDRYRVTSSHMVPTQFHRLLALPEEVKGRYDVSSLRHMVHAAAPCPIDVKRGMIEWWGPVIDEYYAASEGGGTMVLPEDWLKKPGTVGKAWPISEVAILDDQGKKLPPNEIGTVYMAMPGVEFEYYKDKQKTESNRVGRFFTVGDIGYLDDEGFLFLRDRKADMIISGGANIYPAEIEAVLLGYPKVGDAAVFGVPNEDWGEEVKAVIEPAAGVEPTPELADEILAFCADKLARFKTPRSIDFVVEMPRDPNGKLYKRRLRDPYWEGREQGHLMATASAPGGDRVRLDIDGPIATITNANVDKQNAFDDDMDARLFEILGELRQRSDIRAVIWRADGKSWSSGRDVSVIGNVVKAASHHELMAAGHRGIQQLWDLDAPVIVAIQGWAIGGSFQRALLCDVRIAAKDARFALPELSFGVIPDTGGVGVLYQMCGHGLVSDMVLTGRRLSAAEALAYGIVSRVVPRDELDATAREMAEKIAAAPAATVKMARRVIARLARPEQQAAMGDELIYQTFVNKSDDYAEMRASRAENRTPEYRGS